ncbi:MAG TPA: hypothetical protein VLB09_02775, partial [Nitrospiria bacterium]|nr:hypothetical protein [Nitrospiria bacterium]
MGKSTVESLEEKTRRRAGVGVFGVLSVLSLVLMVLVPPNLWGSHQGRNAPSGGRAETSFAGGVSAVQEPTHSKNGLFYMTHSMSNNLVVVDPISQQIIKTVEVGSRPLGVTVTKNGRYAITANFDSHNVSVVDLKTHTVVKSIPVGLG